tara:strand:+ start:154 stop:591 length:438 start_codon:yes stop_codon:yes gene_type:complete
MRIFYLLVFLLFGFGCGNNDIKDAGSTDLNKPGMGLQGQNQIFKVQAQWLEGPFVGQASKVDVQIFELDDSLPESVEDFDFLPYMEIHGHPGSTRKMRIESTSEKNRFLVSGFTLIMPGPWELWVTAVVNGNKGRVSLSFEANGN